MRSFHARVVAFAARHEVEEKVVLAMSNIDDVARAERRARRAEERRNGPVMNPAQLLHYARQRRRGAVTHPGKRR